MAARVVDEVFEEIFDKTLTPDDAVDVTEKLLPAQNKSYMLGMKLKLPQHEVEAIHSRYSEPRYHLLHVITKFLNQEEPKPMWRVILEALKSSLVDQPALAKEIKSNLIATPPVGTDSAPDVPGLTTRQQEYMHVAPATSEDVQKLISELKKSFNSLKNAVRECLEKRRISVKQVVNVLTSLSADGDDCHKMFLESHVKELCAAVNQFELFVTMNFHWNYLDPSLLDYLVREFTLGDVRNKMKAYKSDLQEFRMETPLTLFHLAQKRMREKPSYEFREMVIKFNWPKDVTLETVEHFRQEYASYYNLRDCAMMIAHVHSGSAVNSGSIVTWFIPESITGKLKEKKPKKIFKRYSVNKLYIAETVVYESSMLGAFFVAAGIGLTVAGIAIAPVGMPLLGAGIAILGVATTVSGAVAIEADKERKEREAIKKYIDRRES